MRYFSFDESSGGTANVGCKPVRQGTCPEPAEGYLPGGLCLWMQKAVQTPESKQNPRNPRNPWLNIYIFFVKFVLIRG